MLSLLFTLISGAAAVKTFPVETYRRLKIDALALDASRLPPLYQDLTPHFDHLNVYFAAGDSTSAGFLSAEYFVRRADGTWVTVNTGFRQLKFLDVQEYNARLLRLVEGKLKRDAFANLPIEDVREPYFAEPAMVLGIMGKDVGFSQEISLAIPADRFREPAPEFYVQVRLKHFEGDRLAPESIEARRFIDGVARAEALTAGEARQIHQLTFLARGCDDLLIN